MAFDEDSALDRAERAEARYRTLNDQMERIREDGRAVLEMFAARKQANGTYRIDYEKLARNLGPEQCLALRAVIDDVWNIRGAPGERPRIRLAATATA